MNGDNDGLVYSTEKGGRLCPTCHFAPSACICKRTSGTTAAMPALPKDGIVRVGRETKGRKGAGVTVVTGVPLAPAQLIELCTRLKKRCGSGGAVKNGVLEIQGDHRDVLEEELSKSGWVVKRVGG